MLKLDLKIGSVVGVADFPSALETLATETDIGVITLADNLPGLPEEYGLQRLRIEYPSLIVVAVATSRRRDHVFEALSSGVHGFIPKDLEPTEMIEAFKCIFSGQIYVPPLPWDQSIEPWHELPSPMRAENEILTARQCQVISLMAAGQSNKQIARSLNIAEGTVKVHLNAAFRALGVHNRVGAIGALRNWPVMAMAPSTDDQMAIYRALDHRSERGKLAMAQ